MLCFSLLNFYTDFSRWEVIANYMNIHSSSGIKRTAKDVIGKAKSLQKLGKLILKNQFVTLDAFLK